MKTHHHTLVLALAISAILLAPKSARAAASEPVPGAEIPDQPPPARMASPAAGEPVPGAEIYIELEPDVEPIAHVTTDQNGRFFFALPPNRKPPAAGTFKLKITPPKGFKHGTDSQTVSVPFKAEQARGGSFRYVLSWIPAAAGPNEKPAQNRGTFAVSGKSGA